ncbi:cyanophycinase [Hymenobacter daecheongensis DSM 21074]|uniref:Cyanophycinase n=1 Tax=Hymenobacter daecheongensis DSM 21074 TaxID=1121955 RepID=A0A1M6AG68_9BACT|nr:cyanophycinase [Hymenobacter daecheongensis]SHI35422.1 cyanophycinase [Hymenobacter daecheongensis DSM 21074]
MPQPSAPPLGTLVALGGGDDDAMLALLSDLLPAPDARIEILAMAASDATATGTRYIRALRELGCSHVRHLTIDERHSADKPATLRRLQEASLLFFTGGDQELITESLHGTEFLRQLLHRYHTDAGFFVAGTSAGASVLGDQMLVGGHGWRALRKGGIHTVHGLGLVPQLLLDQHFVERGRFGRLAHAVLVHPMCLGIGLAEETGIIIRGGNEAEVFGDGVVMVVDGRHLRGSNLGRVGRGEPVAGQDFRVHLLVAGQRFLLRPRQVLENGENS